MTIQSVSDAPTVAGEVATQETRKRRYPMAEVERMLTEAGYKLEKVNKRYLVTKDGVERHTSPQGFQWYELYRFCMSEVLGCPLVNAISAHGNGTPVGDTNPHGRILNKMDKAFLLKRGFHVIKYHASYVLIKDHRASLPVNAENKDKFVSVFVLPSKEEAAKCVSALKTLYHKVDNVHPLQDPVLLNTKLNDFIENKFPEIREVVPTLAEFEYKPLFKVTDASMKLVSKLPSLKGVTNFKITRANLKDELHVTDAEIDQLIADDVLHQCDKYITLRPLVAV